MNTRAVLCLASQPKEVLDAGAGAADTLTKTVLGSLIVVLTIAVGLLVWLLIRAKNQHLEDKDKMASTMKDLALEQRGLTHESEKAFSAVVDAVGDLASDIGHMKTDVSARLDSLKGAVDGTSKRVDAMAVASKDVDQNKYLAAKGGI